MARKSGSSPEGRAGTAGRLRRRSRQLHRVLKKNKNTAKEKSDMGIKAVGWFGRCI